MSGPEFDATMEPDALMLWEREEARKAKQPRDFKNPVMTLFERAVIEDRPDLFERIAAMENRKDKNAGAAVAGAAVTSGISFADSKTLAARPGYNGTETPLMMAALHGANRSIERLLGLKAPLYEESLNGGNAAHFAAAGGHVSTLKLLESKGMDLDKPNRLRDTPFDIAVIAGNKDAAAFFADYYKRKQPAIAQRALDRALGNATTGEMAQYLIDLGAQADSLSRDGRATPLHELGKHHPHSLHPYLRDARIDYEGVFDVLMGQEERRPDPNARNAAGLPPLQLALERQLDRPIVEGLLKETSTENLKRPDYAGATAVHLVMGYKQADAALLQSMLERGEKKAWNKENDKSLGNVRDSDNRTPLHYAVLHNRTDLVPALLPYSDPNAMSTVAGKPLHTPVHMAVFKLIHQSKNPQDMQRNLGFIRLLRTDENARMKGWQDETPLDMVNKQIEVFENKLKALQNKGAAVPFTQPEIDLWNALIEAKKAIEGPGPLSRAAEKPLMNNEALKAAVASVRQPADAATAAAMDEKQKPLPAREQGAQRRL